MKLLLFTVGILALVMALAVFVRMVFRKLKEENPSFSSVKNRPVPLWISPRLASVLCILFLLSIGRAQAQTTPTTIQALTNLPAAYPGTFQTNLFASDTNSLGIPTNNVIQLWQGSGCVFMNQVSNTVGTGGSLNMLWAVSHDGINWTYPPYGGFTITNTAAGTTPPVWNGVNIPGTILNNYAYASPYAITNTALAGTNTALINAHTSKAYAVTGYP